jgi:CBS-domain-containing membrane protein
MKAMDVMVRDVVTVKPETDVASAIKLLIEHDISALPVVDDGGRVVGMLSEADLVRRAEIGTDKQRPWWLEALTPGSMLAEEFAKAQGLRVSEVMSPHVVSASEETPLAEIATLLEKHRIKRVPIIEDGKLVGIEGQTVIATGPYAFVRHPMYAGALVMLIGTPLALGSWWGLFALLLISPVLIWRLLDEERFLRQNLPGYMEYQTKVKYRLLPFIW